MVAGATYRAAPPDLIRIVPLDVLTLIYHSASGITHVVASPVPEILEAMGDASLALEDILSALRTRFELTDPDPTTLAARLEELVAAGLITRQ